MRAAFVVDTDRVEIREIDKPSIGTDDVLIRVRAGGVCGSDLHLFEGTHAFRKPPAILGHEFAGEITEVGANVTKFKPGDRVTGNPIYTCGTCPQCVMGLTAHCANKRVPGTPAWIGAFSEYFPMPQELAHKLADSVPFATGALVEPLAVAEHALRRITVAPGKTLAILGSGSIGLLALFLAKRGGYETVICTDTVAANREMALRFGADAALDPLSASFAQKILEHTKELGVDATVVTAGGDAILDQASEITRKGGDIVLVSMITRAIPVHSYSYVFKEQRLIGSMLYETPDFEKAARVVNSGADLSAFVTHRFPLEKTQQAMETLRNKAEPVIKVIVEFD